MKGEREVRGRQGRSTRTQREVGRGVGKGKVVAAMVVGAAAEKEGGMGF